MKKLLFLVVSLVMTTTSVSVAQTGSTVMWGKPTYAMKGGENGKYYRIVVKSDKDRKTQIDDMTAILRKYNIVENINLDEVDDVMATFAVPFRLPLTQDVGKGPMGVPYVEPPVILSGELYDNFTTEVTDSCGDYYFSGFNHDKSWRIRKHSFYHNGGRQSAKEWRNVGEIPRGDGSFISYKEPILKVFDLGKCWII